MQSLRLASRILFRLRMIMAEHHEYTPDSIDVSAGELFDELKLLVRTAHDQIKLVARMRRDRCRG
jgi:hypothetical protein